MASQDDEKVTGKNTSYSSVHSYAPVEKSKKKQTTEPPNSDDDE